MIRFDEKYFDDFRFEKEQIAVYLNNALKDLNIAKSDTIPEVKFTYAYSAVMKGGIALLSFYNKKVKSVAGHHVKTIEAIARILKDDSIDVIGNAMRAKRNLDFYGGGVQVAEKEVREYIEFTTRVLNRIKDLIAARS